MNWQITSNNKGKQCLITSFLQFNLLPDSILQFNALWICSLSSLFIRSQTDWDLSRKVRLISMSVRCTNWHSWSMMDIQNAAYIWSKLIESLVENNSKKYRFFFKKVTSITTVHCTLSSIVQKISVIPLVHN